LFGADLNFDEVEPRTVPGLTTPGGRVYRSARYRGQEEVKPDLRRINWLPLCIGFVAGLCHVAIFFVLATGSGHAGPSHRSLLPYLFFGYGSLLWPVLPPFQYVYYAHLAYHRLKKAAVVSTALHYGSAVALIACFGNSGSLLPEPISSFMGHS
jgi:hypothetical protein